ncbi:uncharacterized protein LOC124890624 [Capsicum annuum]|uniref:uncharacterized protein LOC124890624 n=1 Tax=Capsicum annuum TaxID=4072 RepID=UPI001FB08A26|nr:uncharacterized protein LOC124890624 [Capsicum annuum]
MRNRIRKFTFGLSHKLILESKDDLFNKDMDISRLVVYIPQVEEEKKKQAEMIERLSKKFCYSDQGGVVGCSSFSMHYGFCEKKRNKCFKYGQTGHLQRDCPSKVASGANKTPVVASSTPTPKGTTSTSGFGTGQNHLLSMGSLSYVDEEKWYLVKDIHHLTSLRVRLLDFENGGAIVYETVRSYFGAEVNMKKILDPILMQIKNDAGR